MDDDEKDWHETYYEDEMEEVSEAPNVMDEA